MVALLVNVIGSLAESILPLIKNTGCRDPLRCTEVYLYVFYSIMLVLSVFSLIFIVALIVVIQCRVKWTNKCAELDDC
jgi:uncharacterized membrane protein